MTQLLRDLDRIFGRGDSEIEKVLVLILTSKLDESLKKTVAAIPDE